ncbi:GAF domain-containing protein [Streptomyces sp. NBC_01190]|uniref:GAF domain-containing protein n=1 Tax=Streptomyces sp. NBC_01190 TaxID=2903767 RepID=UPI003864F49B|nr:GAF domain-containing protein [Streptomyces sp. NBC_01190]
MGSSRVQRVAEAFSDVADTFDDRVDPLVLADRLVGHCARLTDADTAGLTLISARGRLRTVAVGDGRAENLEAIQAQIGQGPGADSWRTGEIVRAPWLPVQAARWPHFTEVAEGLGILGAYALPVTVGRAPVGVLTLLVTGADGLPEGDLSLASSLAGVTAGAMLRWRAEPPRPSDILTRVQSVISSKASLETALGMLAAAGGLTIPEAAKALETYGRRGGLGPVVVARQLLQRRLAPEAVLAAVAAPPPGSAPR